MGLEGSPEPLSDVAAKTMAWLAGTVKRGAKNLKKFVSKGVYGDSSAIDLPANAQKVNVRGRIDGHVLPSTIHGWFEGFLYGKPGIFVWHKLGLYSPEIRFISYDDTKYSVSLPLTSKDTPAETLEHLRDVYSVQTKCSTLTVDKLRWIFIGGRDNTSGSCSIHRCTTLSTTEGTESRSDHRQTIQGNTRLPFAGMGGHGSASHSSENRQHEGATRGERVDMSQPAGSSFYEWQLGVEDLDEAGQVTYIKLDLFIVTQDEKSRSLPSNLEPVQDLLRKRFEKTTDNH